MDYPQNLSLTYPEPCGDTVLARGHERGTARQVIGYIRCHNTARNLPVRWLEYSHGTWQEMRSVLLSRVGFGAHDHADLRISLDRGDRPRRDWGPRLTVERFLLWTRLDLSPVGWDEEIQADRDEWVEISDGLEEPVSPSTMRGRRSDGSLDW